MHRYSIEIQYSEEDEGFIAVAPELPGCSAFGKTEELALRELKVAMDLWLRTAMKEGRRIPVASGKGAPVKAAPAGRKRNGRISQAG
jgi:predicted RNase H-like HicB family nuclease